MHGVVVVMVVRGREDDVLYMNEARPFNQSTSCRPL